MWYSDSIEKKELKSIILFIWETNDCSSLHRVKNSQHENWISNLTHWNCNEFPNCPIFCGDLPNKRFNTSTFFLQPPTVCPPSFLSFVIPFSPRLNCPAIAVRNGIPDNARDFASCITTRLSSTTLLPHGRKTSLHTCSPTHSSFSHNNNQLP